jgi:hypothetical protein
MTNIKLMKQYIENILNDINPHNATGSDQISGKILKRTNNADIRCAVVK